MAECGGILILKQHHAKETIGNRLCHLLHGKTTCEEHSDNQKRMNDTDIIAIKARLLDMPLRPLLQI
jgi:hypothetical protein